jgi:hypothetical protein
MHAHTHTHTHVENRRYQIFYSVTLYMIPLRPASLIGLGAYLSVCLFSFFFVFILFCFWLGWLTNKPRHYLFFSVLGFQADAAMSSSLHRCHRSDSIPHACSANALPHQAIYPAGRIIVLKEHLTVLVNSTLWVTQVSCEYRKCTRRQDHFHLLWQCDEGSLFYCTWIENLKNCYSFLFLISDRPWQFPLNHMFLFVFLLLFCFVLFCFFLFCFVLFFTLMSFWSLGGLASGLSSRKGCESHRDSVHLLWTSSSQHNFPEKEELRLRSSTCRKFGWRASGHWVFLLLRKMTNACLWFIPWLSDRWWSRWQYHHHNMEPHTRWRCQISGSRTMESDLLLPRSPNDPCVHYSIESSVLKDTLKSPHLELKKEVVEFVRELSAHLVLSG